MIDNTIKSLGELIKSLDDGSNEAIKVAQDTIDIAANGVLKELQMTTPRASGGLVGSLKMQPTKSRINYGKEIVYDGYDDKGRPYQVIANSLNRGIIPTKISKSGKRMRGRSRKNRTNGKGALLFMDNAQKQLVGLTDKIRDNVIENINSKLK